MKMPRVADVLRDLETRFGCTVTQEMAVSPPVPFVERTVDGEVLEYPFDLDLSERMTPSVLRSLCRALQLDVKDFGLELG
jgi:hypothetical protein